ncbi:hypothetical protein DFH06DRAFT_1130912 [Mycena polygramma]|nr:hypothetical protein DFH06DRAFT_1130912 [Mycena polygramma]
MLHTQPSDSERSSAFSGLLARWRRATAETGGALVNWDEAFKTSVVFDTNIIPKPEVAWKRGEVTVVVARSADATLSRPCAWLAQLRRRTGSSKWRDLLSVATLEVEPRRQSGLEAVLARNTLIRWPESANGVSNDESGVESNMESAHLCSSAIERRSGLVLVHLAIGLPLHINSSAGAGRLFLPSGLEAVSHWSGHGVASSGPCGKSRYPSNGLFNGRFDSYEARLLRDYIQWAGIACQDVLAVNTRAEEKKFSQPKSFFFSLGFATFGTSYNVL